MVRVRAACGGKASAGADEAVRTSKGATAYCGAAVYIERIFM